MKQYHDLVTHILQHGEQKADRTGTGTLSVFGHQMRFNLNEGLPLLGTKFTPIKAILTELLWFIRGDDDILWLQEHGCTIWDEWATEDGGIGPMYGKQWRSWPAGRTEVSDFSVDQLAEVINNLQRAPDSRRHVVSAWNVAYLPDETLTPQCNVEQGDMALAPCHCLFQFYVSADKRLSCQVYQRSADVFLGVPFNIASYAALTMVIAQSLGYGLGDLIWTGGDCHLYSNHLTQVDELQRRWLASILDPAPHALPTLTIAGHVGKRIDDYTLADFTLTNYFHAGKLPAPVAI